MIIQEGAKPGENECLLSSDGFVTQYGKEGQVGFFSFLSWQNACPLWLFTKNLIYLIEGPFTPCGVPTSPFS